MLALTSEELIAWVEETSTRWHKLLVRHREALALPCDVMDTGTVAALLQHIVAVELRYAQRLCSLPPSDYANIRMDSADALYATHATAMALLLGILNRTDDFWAERIELVTRSHGTLHASRRGVMVHMLMHSVRHYAQLATLLRQHNIKPDWPMDYIFMDATIA